MDRVIAYDLETPEVSDFLNVQNNAMIALGYLAQAVCGSPTWVSGLSCTPTTPASMSVNVGPGQIWSMEVVDQTAFGDSVAGLSANNNPLMKGGLLQATTSFPLVAPTTSGQSVVYLLAGTFSETDGNPENLSFYNTDLPIAPTSQILNTTRSQTCTLELIRGTSATTGTQAIPATPAGYVPLYIITVNFGQTAITAANILIAPNAPFLPNNLAGLRIPVVGGTLNVYVSPYGNDSNPGTNASTPFLTINGALSAIAQNYDLTGVTLQINLAAGTYAGCIVDGHQIGATVSIVGNVSSPGTVTVNGVNQAAVYSSRGAAVNVSGFTVTASGSGGDYVTGGVGLYAANGASIGIGPGMIFGTCTATHISSSLSAYIGPTNTGISYTITGGSSLHWNANNAANVSWADCNITIVGTPAIGCFAQAVGGGILNVWNINFTGSCTGIRYYATSYGSIGVHGASASYLPGNTAGSVSNGLYA